MAYFTGRHVNVTERISKKRTLLVLGTNQESKEEAEALAVKTSSYAYSVYEDVKHKGLVQIGYGVPK